MRKIIAMLQALNICFAPLLVEADETEELENKKAVIACGNILAAAQEQIAEQGFAYDLYSVPFVKPINREQLKAIVKSHPDGLITIEEHQASCGMGSAIVELVNDMHAKGELVAYPIIKRVAIPDEFALIAGTQAYLRDYEGLKIS